jgi:hypothetical protein
MHQLRNVRVSLVIVFAVAATGTAGAQIDVRDPGSASQPPGPGCQIGTSGCYPSAPPGPVTPPSDPGAPQNYPPPEVSPHDVPFFGALPGLPIDVTRQPAPPVKTQPTENQPPTGNVLIPSERPTERPAPPPENQPQNETQTQPPTANQPPAQNQNQPPPTQNQMQAPMPGQAPAQSQSQP